MTGLIFKILIVKFNLGHLDLSPSIEEVFFSLSSSSIFFILLTSAGEILELSQFHTQGMCIAETEIAFPSFGYT